MIESGEEAPSFTLPAVRGDEIVDLDSVLGSEIVVLAFYPGDFNPACSGTETGLDELDLFTMQKDVQVLAISGDSVYSHRAFADQYDLHMPLLSDTDGAVAEAYGVTAEEGAGHLTKRAVVVVDHTETVRYTWASERPENVPRAEEIRGAIEAIGDDETAESRYRVGYAHYMEGRRAFTSAMKAYENSEWMMAQTDFTRAGEEFDEASEEFNTAVRFAESERRRTYFERAEQKSESLWRAADWLADSASAFASGEGARGDSLRRDAEAPLETARDLHEPPVPDEFPPEEDPVEQDGESERIHPLADEDEPAATLDADIDDQLGERESDSEPAANPPEQTGSEGGDGQSHRPAGKSETGEQPPESGRPTADDTAKAGGTEIDDEELEEITAELEEQTEAAELSDPEPEGDSIPDEPGITRDDAGEETDLEAGEDVELELSDPTEKESETEETSDEAGDHGVPDSL